IRAFKTEQALLGKTWNSKTLMSTLPILEREFTPISDVRGSKSYRQRLITSLFEKFFYDDQGGALSEAPSAAGKPPLLVRPQPHESGHKHVTGEAIYVDDATVGRGMLEVWPVCSPHARAKILRRDASAAKTMPGIAAVLLAEDIPGLNDVGAVRHDEILLADKEVFYHGHIVALIVGETSELCRAAAAKVIVEYETLPPIFTIEEAIGAESFHSDPHFIRRGTTAAALEAAPRTLEGDLSLGGQ